MKPKIHLIYSFSKYIVLGTCSSWSSYNYLTEKIVPLKIILFDSVLKKRIVINNWAINNFWSLSDLLFGKKCRLWPQTTQELLAVLHEKIQIDIQVISMNTLQTKMFYNLPLSLKILLNLCLLSCKQETACKILKSEEVRSSFFSFPSQSVSLILQIQFWILVLIRPGMANKSWWSHASILLWTSYTSSYILSGSLKSWITKQYIQDLWHWR